jgi:hypothetical protein
VDSEIQGNKIYYISHSGYGRMPIEKKHGLNNVSILFGQVVAPKNIKVNEKYIEKYSKVYVAKLDEFTKEIVKHSNQGLTPDQMAWQKKIDEALEADENTKKSFAYRKMSDEEFDTVCQDKQNTALLENTNPIFEPTFFGRFWNFIFS